MINFQFPIPNSKFIIISILFVSSLVKANWKTYTNTNFINDLCADSAYLYCATQGGFTIFSIRESSFTDVFTNSDGLPANQINCLTIDKSGQIWLGTYRGIVIFNPTSKVIQSYYALGTYEQSIITCLECSGDTILVGTRNGLFVIDTKGTALISDDNIIRLTNYPSQFSSKILSLGVLDDFWIGAWPGIIRLNRNLQTWTPYLRPLGDSVKAMTKVNDTLYIVTELGLLKFDGANFIPVINFASSKVVFDLQSADNKFYIATPTGLLQYDGIKLDTILNQDTRTITIASSLWIGLGGLTGLGGGIMCYQNGLFKNYQSAGLASNLVSCVISDTSGVIYGLHYLTNWGFKSISCKKPFQNWQILRDTLINSNVAAITKENNPCFGHWALDGGVSCFREVNNQWQVFQWTASHYRNVIGAIGVDHNSVIWTYNQYNTIIAIDSNGQTVEFTIPGLSRPERSGYEFAFDAQNRVWLGTTVGLIMIDYNNTLADFSDDNYKIIRQGLPDQEVNSVTVDALDRIWCATAQGAVILNGDAFQIYNHTHIKRIKADAWGNVWLLSSSGLEQYNIYTKETTTYTAENSPIIPNLENDDKFYQWLSVNEKQGFLLIATKQGISQFFYQPPALESLTQILIYPNPFIVSQHQVITFDSLPKGAVIKIYSLNGKFLEQLEVNPYSAKIIWQPARLASGIYLAVITADNKRQIAKFAIIR